MLCGHAKDAAENPELMAGLANVLKEASAALARLGGSKASSQVASIDAKVNIKEAASALAQVASALDDTSPAASKIPTLSDKLSAIAKGGRGRSRSRSRSRRSSQSKGQPAVGGSEEDVRSFVAEHGLDEWLIEVLMMLSPRKRSSVLHPPLNVERARNPNGVVMSRVKQVASVDQRIQMFIKVNDLGEGVVDRLSGLTSEQCEAVMESGLKIQRAANPSGVAMSRISEALRTISSRGGRPITLHPRESGESREGRSRRHSKSRRRRGDRGEKREDDLPQDVRRLVEELGLESWCGEVLRRLSLWQRQSVVRELGNMNGVRNPSGVVMSRIKTVITPEELLAIFVDLNGLDRAVEAKLWELTPEQRTEVLAPGIFVQNVRNTSTAVRSRIANVLEGRNAMGPRHDGSDRDRRKGQVDLVLYWSHAAVRGGDSSEGDSTSEGLQQLEVLWKSPLGRTASSVSPYRPQLISWSRLPEDLAEMPEAGEWLVEVKLHGARIGSRSFFVCAERCKGLDPGTVRRYFAMT
ncbi:unnamed protein product [Symbiodinium sp. KB8]|nr:unnamed protein product [Symbiodinium sp. KB8]